MFWSATVTRYCTAKACPPQDGIGLAPAEGIGDHRAPSTGLDIKAGLSHLDFSPLKREHRTNSDDVSRAPEFA
jgi:hypothetical protein